MKLTPEVKKLIAEWLGSILADDMELCKTLQVTTFLQKLKDEKLFNKKYALVVAPTGLLANWQAELQRFAPSLSVFLYHGAKRDLKDFFHDIFFTSYGLVRSDADQLNKLKWQVVVKDEAQNIKNNDTVLCKAVRAIKADAHIAISGTPVENRLSGYRASGYHLADEACLEADMQLSYILERWQVGSITLWKHPFITKTPLRSASMI